jgi:hypothetical protein
MPTSCNKNDFCSFMAYSRHCDSVSRVLSGFMSPVADRRVDGSSSATVPHISRSLIDLGIQLRFGHFGLSNRLAESHTPNSQRRPPSRKTASELDWRMSRSTSAHGDRFLTRWK